MANPYVKQTWTDGVSQTTATRMGVMETGIFDAHFQPTAGVARTTNQSVVTGTSTVVSFNLERWDQDGLGTSLMYVFGSQPTRITCKVAGTYLLTGGGTWAGNPVNARIEFFLNGTTVIGSPGQLVADWRTMNLTSAWPLAVNDYVELRVQQNSGGALNLATAEFAVARLA